MRGTLFLIIGPSGAGKDALLDGARQELSMDSRFVFTRRVITRSEDAGSERHVSINCREFEKRIKTKQFFSHWQAHGHYYGLPISLRNTLEDGQHVLANVSRTVINDISKAYGKTRIIEITAPKKLRFERLKGRGRENTEDITHRLERAAPTFPVGIEILTIINDGTLDDGIRSFVAAIRSSVNAELRLRCMPIDTWHENICFLNRNCSAYLAEDYLGGGKVDVLGASSSVRAKVNLIDDNRLIDFDQIGLSLHAFEELGLAEGSNVTIERTPSPKSIKALRAKVAGNALSTDDMQMVIRDIAENRYTDKEISAFLVAAAWKLSIDEVKSLTQARAEFAHQFDWGHKLVVDKHSMGGIPGSRITMIVIPIVAAHGLLIPKTSSRAITSAAGTADAMEVLARVDLYPHEVESVVEEAKGCIAWNGRLNHSSVDDVMNSITRPLGIDSTKWAVASILSKKLAAGATHAIIDIPVGPYAKVQQLEEGRKLSRLFERVGSGIGLKVIAKMTEGSCPIGQGIGPALEVRDVYKVLRSETDAPIDLREKALDFAALILEWDSNIKLGHGRSRASDLLNSGEALNALEHIIDLQGRHDRPIEPGELVHEVISDRSGVVRNIDSFQISGIARAAGAPMDKSAGIDLLVQKGAILRAGETIYRIHASADTDFLTARDRSNFATGVVIES